MALARIHTLWALHGFPVNGRPTCARRVGRSSDRAHISFNTKAHWQEAILWGECGRPSSKNSSLVKHQRVHMGEKPFSCGECGCAFSWRSHLAQPQRVRTRERLFTRCECGRAFAESSGLLVPHRTHAGRGLVSAARAAGLRSSLAEH